MRVAAAKKRSASYDYFFMVPDGTQLAEIVSLIDAKKVKVLTDRIVPFQEAKSAMRYVESGRAKGKVILSF